MRQLIIAFSLIGSFVVYAAVVDLFDTLVMFLLFGILPGRSEPISANHMLSIYTFASIAVLVYAFRVRLATFGELIRTGSKRSNA